jgi:Fic family protein
MSGSVTVNWNGMAVEAANPDRIADWNAELSAQTVRSTERAAARVRRSGDQAVGAFEVAARLLLRTEGLASSAIEGLRASPADVALAEAGAENLAGVDGQVAGWVADNLAVVRDALDERRPLSASLLFKWHTRLMGSHAMLDARHIGAYRDTLGWVGGPNPRLAAHVASPVELIPELMDDLFAFVARNDVDPIAQAAVAHAQFETVHPFADGNGRLGRVMIGCILTRRLDVGVPPPVSLEMARDIGGYQAGLTLFRQGQVDTWVRWFADAVGASAERSSAILAAVAALQDSWRSKIADVRSDAAARRLCELLPEHPVLSSALVAELLGVSEQAGRVALDELTKRSILAELPVRPGRVGRPRRWYAAEDLLDLLGR